MTRKITATLTTLAAAAAFLSAPAVAMAGHGSRVVITTQVGHHDSHYVEHVRYRRGVSFVYTDSIGHRVYTDHHDRYFWVNRYGERIYTHGPHHHGHRQRVDPAVAGAVVGVGLLGAILAGGH